MVFTPHKRFTNSTVSELQEANCSPIYGYQDLVISTLEEATEKLVSLIPDIENYVSKAKKQCKQRSDLLTRDESAAIYLYTMPISFSVCLNETLRAENRHILEPWLPFLKLFLTALEKLPSVRKTIWRGISANVTSAFTEGYDHILWSVNSCSIDLKVVEKFLGATGTVLAIDSIHGKDISSFSACPDEQEIVLMPGTRVMAKSQSLNFIDRFFLVSLEEKTYRRLVCLTYRKNFQIIEDTDSLH